MLSKEFINAIQSKIDSLDENDTKGILMWSDFKEFSKEWKPKRKSIEERKNSFYKEVANFKHAYPSNILREFYDYWTECSPNSKLMPFEKERNKRAFDVNLRLKKWFRNSNSESDNNKFKPINKKHNR